MYITYEEADYAMLKREQQIMRSELFYIWGNVKKIASATEISNEMGIPRGYLEKVLFKN